MRLEDGVMGTQFWGLALAIALAGAGAQVAAASPHQDEQDIRALQGRLAASVSARNLDAVMHSRGKRRLQPRSSASDLSGTKGWLTPRAIDERVRRLSQDRRKVADRDGALVDPGRERQSRAHDELTPRVRTRRVAVFLSSFGRYPHAELVEA